MLTHLLAQLECLSTPKRYCVAFSGGRDSHVLLHALVQLRQKYPDIELRAVHIHHGLQAQADAWAGHCERVCQDLHLTFTWLKVDVDAASPLGLEAAARTVRYAALASVLKPNESLLTAHHRNDQVETLLLQLLRGAGPKGLAAMPAQKPFGLGEHLRPLLEVDAAEIYAYAKAHDLNFIEDDSNKNLHFDRNFLRLEILPKLIQRWPGALTTISRSSQHCAEMSALAQEIAQQDLVIMAGEVQTLKLEPLRQLSQPRRANLIRFWLSERALPLPSTKKLTELIQQMLTAKPDAKPLVAWTGAEVRRFNGELYAMPPLPGFDSMVVLPWDYQSPLELPGGLGVLQAEKMQGEGICLAVDAQGMQQGVSIRFRQGGERLPGADGHTQSLKKLMQVWRIPPWLRGRIPLLYQNNQLVAVIGYQVASAS